MAAASQSAESYNWAALPLDLLELISKKLPFGIDYVHFRSVCTSWHSAAPFIRFAPLLMFPFDPNSNNLPFYSLSNKTVCNIHLPEARNKVFCGSSYGWLFLMDEAGSTSLLNPFTRTQIQLPSVTEQLAAASGLNVSKVGNRYVRNLEGGHTSPINLMHMQQTFIRKAVLSSNPGTNNACTVMAILGNSNQVAFSRPGDERWTLLDTDLNDIIKSIVHCNRRFYVVDRRGCMAVCSMGPPVRASEVPSLKLPFQYRRYTYHLFESNRALALAILVRNSNSTRLIIFRADIWQRPWWAKVESLDNSTVFLSSVYSSSIVAGELSGCNGNCAYFCEPEQFIPRNWEPEAHQIAVMDVANHRSELIPCNGLLPSREGVCWVTPNLSGETFRSGM